MPILIMCIVFGPVVAKDHKDCILVASTEVCDT